MAGKIQRAKRSAEETAYNTLDRLLFAKILQGKNVRKDCLLLPKDLGPLWVHFEEGRFFEPTDIVSPTIVWPLQLGLVWPYPDNENSLMTQYIRTIDVKELRGKVKQPGQYNVEWITGNLSPEREFVAARMYALWRNGWRHNPHLDRPDFIDKSIPLRIHMLQSIALTYRYEWGAQFSLPGTPRIILPATPKGILQLFSDRDKPEDRDRRAALRHWVNSHLRRTRTAEEEFVEVRAHLRGQFDFHWRGFDVRVVPSQFDLERSAQCKVGAKPRELA